MGMFNKLAHVLKMKKEKMSILIIGLNNSGKSTIVNQFKNPREQTAITIPTVGFTMDQFSNHGINFSVIDTSGAGRYRNLWEHHFKHCQGIVYVIDSSDKMRLIVVKDELDILLKHPDLKNKAVPILFYNNKIDCEDSLSSGKIAAVLSLENVKDKPWYICSSNALTGEGLEEGVQWLVQQIRVGITGAKEASKRHSKQRSTPNNEIN